MHVLALAALFALGLTAHGTVIYSETFKAFADYGWSAYQNNGTNRTAAAASPGVTVVKGVPAGFDTVTLALPSSDPKKFARLRVTP